MSENKQQSYSKQEQLNTRNQKILSYQPHQGEEDSGDVMSQILVERNGNIDKSDEPEQNSLVKDRSSNDEQINGSPQESDDNQPEDQDPERSSNLQDYQSQEDEDHQQDSNQKSDNKDQEQGRSDEDLKKEEPSGKKCFNRLCNSKKIYKKLRSKVEHAKYRFFCRQCYQSYYNNDFCQFCEQIYSSTANSDDDDQWIGCDSCSRWNHIDCEKKFRNKDINEVKNENTQYLCLTCSYKSKDKPKNNQLRQNGKKQTVQEEQKFQKQNIEISRDQRTQIFSKKIQPLPSLEFFLQNYNFRLWINENLIKDDLETLRESSKRNQQETRKNKKVKIE